MTAEREPARKPFACPECGGTDWKAVYYEAVWQTITLLDVGGEPVLGDYMSVSGSYDDGPTENEAYVCRECGHRIVLGRFVLVPPEAESAKVVAGLIEELRADCAYDPEGDSTVDALIEYKNALEDLLGRVVVARGLPPSELSAGPQGPS